MLHPDRKGEGKGDLRIYFGITGKWYKIHTFCAPFRSFGWNRKIYRRKKSQKYKSRW